MSVDASSSKSKADRPTSESNQRSYSDAIQALNTLQSNAQVIAAIRASGGKLNDFAIPEMVEYLRRIGHSLEDLDRLNFIHITGTKGKGSTAAFSSSLLCKAFDETSASATEGGPRVGLYSSPHMLLVRERIRLDGLPISETRFAQEFWHVWDKLGETADQRANPDITPVRPVYFRFLTILAFHIFLNTPSLKAVVLEVGIGGKYDSTNIIRTPVVCGVSTLGLDHTALLGNTLEEIAAQKAGIYKQDSIALSVQQPKHSAVEVLRSVAEEVGAPFTLLPQPPRAVQTAALGLPGPHQVGNAFLALALVDSFLKKTDPQSAFVWQKDNEQLSEWAKEALANARWPGRCQTVPTDKDGKGPIFFLDGAHTTDSVALCTSWFHSASSPRAKKALIFNCTNGRSAPELLHSLLSIIKDKEGLSSYKEAAAWFDTISFSTNLTFKNGGSSGDLTSKAVDPTDLEAMSVQRELKAAWQNLVGAETDTSNVHVLPSIEDAIDASFRTQEGAQNVLVAGSLHLVGGVMSHLKQRGALDEKLEAAWDHTQH